MYELMRLMYKLLDAKNVAFAQKTIRKHWSPTAVFLGAHHSEHGTPVPTSKLLPGELSAVTFRVGCYIVRSARRVYNIHEPGYSPDLETPASIEDVELVRKDTCGGNLVGMGFCSWRDRLRITHEISARHKFWEEDDFTYICRAAEARNASWYENISGICVAKKNILVPDSRASLFVCNSWTGSSFGSETWYKLSSYGKIKELHLHDLASGNDEKRFE